MKNRSFNLIGILIVAFLFLGVAGCTGNLSDLDPTDPNSSILDIVDANQIEQWVNAAIVAGQGTQAVGTVTGNPVLVGVGILASTFAAVIGGALLKKKD